LSARHAVTAISVPRQPLKNAATRESAGANARVAEKPNETTTDRDLAAPVPVRRVPVAA